MLGNKKILALFLGLTLGVSTAALAQAPGATTPAVPKVGIVAIQAAIANTNEGKKELDVLQQRFSPKQAELKGLNDEIEGLKKQLQTQGDKLSEEERGNRVRTIEAKQKTLQRNLDDAQSEYQQAEQEVVNRLGTKMLKVMEDYAQKNGYTVIMDVSSPQTPVLYAAESSNITKQLVDAYNAANPSAAPAPAVPSAPAPKSGATAPTPKRP
ncbi:MAG TPA: OmpH family outer membrane protein [Terriglobales bacterium]